MREDLKSKKRIQIIKSVLIGTPLAMVALVALIFTVFVSYLFIPVLSISALPISIYWLKTLDKLEKEV